jgi:hypothetical protein
MVKFATTTLSMTAMTATALVAGLMAFSTTGVPEAKAKSLIEGSVIEGAIHQSHTKTDRLPLRVTGSPCSAQSWPNYDQACQFDRRQPANEVRTVRRVIALR